MSLLGPGRLAGVFLLVVLSLWCVCPPDGSGLAAATPDARTDATCPVLENKLESDHFILRWTNKSAVSEDNISDPEVIRETAVHLEAAWDKLTGLFGRKPYLPPGSSKMEVIFRDLECYAFADPPEAPIELNSYVWMTMPAVRPSTCAHELFHKLQYAYGYKTRWASGRPMLWFTEGTAAWAEVFVSGRVSRRCKLEDMFKDLNLDLYAADDMALPFWIYLVSGNRSTPEDRIMVKLFERYEQTGDVDDALFHVIQDAYGSVDGFFLRFAFERKNRFWQEFTSGSHPYARILGPDGQDLVAAIKTYQSLRKTAVRPVSRGESAAPDNRNSRDAEN